MVPHRTQRWALRSLENFCSAWRKAIYSFVTLSLSGFVTTAKPCGGQPIRRLAAGGSRAGGATGRDRIEMVEPTG
jgi:hypothetical protein